MTAHASPYGHPPAFSTTNGVKVQVGRPDTLDVDFYLDSNQTLTAGRSTTLDSVVATEGQLVFCPAQTTVTEDGLFYVDAVSGATCTFVRVPGFQAGDKMYPGTVIRVRSGTVYGGRRLVIQGTAPLVLGTDGISVELEPDASALASTTAGQGSGLIGSADAGGFTANTTVESQVQEIYQHLRGQQACFSTSLHDFREVSSGGDVGDTTANGGILASDTTPILRGDAAEASEISWATGNVDIILSEKTLPPWFNGAVAATLELWVSSGSTDAATFVVETSWDGGAVVTDSADDAATKSATRHKITATIAAADIPDTARNLTIMLTPPTHGTNAIQLHGWCLKSAPLLLTA